MSMCVCVWVGVDGWVGALLYCDLFLIIPIHVKLSSQMTWHHRQIGPSSGKRQTHYNTYYVLEIIGGGLLFWCCFYIHNLSILVDSQAFNDVEVASA